MKRIVLFFALLLICSVLTACSMFISNTEEESDNDGTAQSEQIPQAENDDDVPEETPSEQRPTYTEEQLQALGRVMVGGEFFVYMYDFGEDGEIDLGTATLTFVDRNFYFGAVAHAIENPLARSSILFSPSLSEINEGGLRHRSIESDDFLAILVEHVNTPVGLVGRLGMITYDTAREIRFGLPEPGLAKMWLAMPDDECGWYEIEILRVWANMATHSNYNDFTFRFTDERLPANFTNYRHNGRSGSPIVQNERLVGALSRGGFALYSGILAADMRFVQLMIYDENFEADLFKDVPTLERYFNGLSFERPTPNITAETLIGTWDWHSGWYTFNADGTGSREWSGVHADFLWTTTENDIFIHIQGDSGVTLWPIDLINNNEMTMAGASFTRGS